MTCVVCHQSKVLTIDISQEDEDQAFALLNFYCNKSAIIAINAIIAIIQ